MKRIFEIAVVALGVELLRYLTQNLEGRLDDLAAAKAFLCDFARAE